MTHSLADEALRYARHGWPIFPLEPRGKKPLTLHGFKDATTDENCVAAWWRETPDANIGFVPGAVRLLVVDVDGPEGEAEGQELGLLSEPTLRVETARGCHLYYVAPAEPVEEGAGKLGAKLDVRGQRGYVILPPSVHETGAVYRFADPQMAALAVPPRALERLRQNGTKPVAAAHAAAVVGEAITAGERNRTLASLAGTMRRRGMSEDAIAAALLEENAGRCRPALDELEVRRIASSVAGYAAAERGEGADNDRDVKLTAPRTLCEILKDPDSQKPPTVVVPGLAWRGRLTLVAAREGVGKTTLFAAAAALVTIGGTFLDQPCAEGAVLWLLVEEHLNDVVIRAVKFQTAPDTFWVLERPEQPLASLLAAVQRIQPKLIIIDTLHRFASTSGAVRDAHAADSWGPLMTALDKLARSTDAALLMSAQATKATGEYRDSSEIGHGVDVVLNLVRPEKDSAVRRLEKQKARWPLEDVVTMELVGSTYRCGGVVRRKLTERRQQVLDALEPPMTFGEWKGAAGATGVVDRTFAYAVKFLVAEGYVEKSGGNTYQLPPDRSDAPGGGVG